MWLAKALLSITVLTTLSVAEESIATKFSLQGLNETKQYTFKMLKYLCTGTPYQRSRLNYCKTVLRRNKPTLLNVSVTVPEVLNYVWVSVKLHYKFATYQPFLIDLEVEACEYKQFRPPNPLADYIFDTFVNSAPALSSPCPHGNRTYAIIWWLEERHTPRSVPAGEYRLDISLFARDNVTLFSSETYVAVRRSGIIGSMIECYASRPVPARDYRLDIKFILYDNVTEFAFETIFSVRRNGVIGSMME